MLHQQAARSYIPPFIDYVTAFTIILGMVKDDVELYGIGHIISCIIPYNERLNLPESKHIGLKILKVFVFLIQVGSLEP